MYCTSGQRGEQYALYCSAQRTSGTCTGTYRTRKPVEAALALWLQSYAHELEEATRAALADAPKPRQDPHKAERRRLGKIIESADAKLSLLLDAYTDGAPGLDLLMQALNRTLAAQSSVRTRGAASIPVGAAHRPP